MATHRHRTHGQAIFRAFILLDRSFWTRSRHFFIGGIPLDAKTALEKQKAYIVPGVALYYDDPLLLVRGEGKHLYDSEGQRYLDFYAGILTISVGHQNPRVLEAVKDQLEKTNHVSTFYLSEPMLEMAERLAELTPGGLQVSLFTGSGTEANETAIHMARRSSRNAEVIALKNGYSGRSALTQSLAGMSNWRTPYEVPGIRHAATPNCYRCPFGKTPKTCGYECAKDVETTIRTTTSGNIAAFIAEPIQGAGGFVTPAPEYFGIVAEIVRKYGGLFIADEVQTGFGRTGRAFGIEHWGVEPDIMTFAKGIANGAPVGATIATPEVAKDYVGPTISTFGGNPISMRAAIATMDVIRDENLTENARIQGEKLRQGLEELKARYPFVGDVRGKGLMQAIEFVREEKTPAPDLMKEFMEETKKRHLLIGKGGQEGNVVRIAPPLIVNADDVHEAVTIMSESVAAMASRHPELREIA